VLMSVVNQEDRGLITIGSVLRSVLFLSSYAPLLVILAILLWSTGPSLWDKLPVLSTSLIILAALSLLLLWLFLRSFKESEPTRVDVEQIQQRDEQIVNYIVTYAIPFLAAPFESKEKALGLGIFFVVVWLLQVKLNLLYINPVLTLFNYHLYQVTTPETVQILLSKKRLGPTGILYAVKAGDNILFESDP
jgi:hypothetical protein